MRFAILPKCRKCQLLMHFGINDNYCFLIDALCVVAIVATVYIFSGLTLIFNPLFYEQIGADSLLAKQITVQFVDYLRSPSFDASQIPQLTEKENSHLLDVKNIIYWLEILLIISLAALFLLRKYLTRNVLLASSIMIILLPLSFFILPFDALFLQFHYIFFPQGNWQFDAATTTLVNIYPEEFFMKFFTKIVVHAWIVGIVLLIYTTRD